MRASIIIAAHQEGALLGKTVESCLRNASDLEREIIVADDASSDGSVDEVTARFPELRILRNEQRLGVSPTKDLGARRATGDVLVFLDAHTNPEPGAILRLVEDVERLEGAAAVTPAIASLCHRTWRNLTSRTGHGYSLELETFKSGWLALDKLRKVEQAGRTFYESPALIGCAFAVARELYDALWGFDPAMRLWGVEDLDFSLKCGFIVRWRGRCIAEPRHHAPEARPTRGAENRRGQKQRRLAERTKACGCLGTLRRC
ncbi:MAG: glycosyltransferase [Pirellulales bacterium]